MEKHQNNRTARNKRSRKRKPPRVDWKKIAAGVLLLIILVITVVIFLKRSDITEEVVSASAPQVETDVALARASGGEADIMAAAASDMDRVEAQQDSMKAQSEKQNILQSYGNLGIVDVSGYLNIRLEADVKGEIIGRLWQYGACEILGTEGEWYHIRSGEVEGYIHSQYVLTDEAAKEKALEEIKMMAVITADSLNIRSAPLQDPSNVIGAAAVNERYEVISQNEGWVQIREGYVSSDYVEVRYALDEARKLDLKEMALNQYDNLVISKVNNYLNIRSTPENQGDGNIIGKFPSRAAGEILETAEGWYHIKSGSITGYITSDPQYTAIGNEARELASQEASLMAIVSTERLNVRTDASTDASIWTQISQEERYPVLQQMDGWVQIELDTSGEEGQIDAAYISTRENNVEVRYALAEAIKFSPLEEQEGEARSLRSQIVNYAIQFVGNPYVWGGTSLTNGADCSGFVLSVMRNFGVSLPRTSSSQSQVGTAVSSSEMRPGDLIFYANGGGTVNHVAMYIGNGQVVHASSRRTGIKISTWNYRTPKVIRRVL